MVNMNFLQFKVIFYNTTKAISKLTIALVFITLSACATFAPTGPAPELPEADAPRGPGLFSGDDGEFSPSDFFDPEKRNKRRNSDITVTGSDVDIPAIDVGSFEEFERFKAWRRAQVVGSIEYQDWLDYQEFLRLKAEK
jgi:hypothetical protein